MLRAYGVDCALNTDYARQKLNEYRRLHSDEIKKAVEKTKTERYGDPHWNNCGKIEETKLNRYGDPYWNNRDKAAATYEKHCAEDGLFAERKVERRKTTCGRLYGDENYHNEERGKMTRLARYGHVNPAHGDNEQKVRRTVRERYGVDYVLQNPEVIRKARSKYFYDGVNFDSSTELYVYLYMKEHAMEFIYKPAVRFRYESCGKTHYYCPDFLFPRT